MLGYFQATSPSTSFTVLVGLGVFATAYLAGITSRLRRHPGRDPRRPAASSTRRPSDWLDLGDWYAVDRRRRAGGHRRPQPRGHRRSDPRTAREAADAPAPPRTCRCRLRMQRRRPAELGARPPASAGRVVLSRARRQRPLRRSRRRRRRELRRRRGQRSSGSSGRTAPARPRSLDAISGFAPQSGSIELGGRDARPPDAAPAGPRRPGAHLPAHRALRRPDGHENIVVGARGREWARRRARPTSTRSCSCSGSTDVADRPAGELSQGRRQLVSIAPCAGRQPARAAARRTGRRTRHRGEPVARRPPPHDPRQRRTTILLVDHDMHLVLNLCDDSPRARLRQGDRARAADAVVQSDRRVAAAYLGSTHGEQATRDRMHERVGQAPLTAGAAARVSRACMAGYGHVTVVRGLRSLGRRRDRRRRSSARTAPARPRCSRRWPGCCLRQAGTVRVDGHVAASGRAGCRRHERASCSSPTTARCSRR